MWTSAFWRFSRSRSLGVYSLILAGWASNSKYPFLGGVRASAQLISYELSMTLSVLPVFLWINAPGTPGTLSLSSVVEFQSQPGFLGWRVVYLHDAALGVHLPDRAFCRNQPPAVRHAGIRGRSRRRLPHRVRRVQVVAVLRRGVLAHDRRLGGVHAALPRRLESAALGSARRLVGWLLTASRVGCIPFWSACSRSASSSGRSVR